MPFIQYGKCETFPRNDAVDIYVREVVLNADIPTQRVDMIEIREYLKGGEVFGHGVVLPRNEVKDLQVALERVLAG